MPTLRLAAVTAAISAVIGLGVVAPCMAAPTLSYDFNDGQGALANHKSDSTNTPAATAIAGGTEYVFAFGQITNKNWNWDIRAGGRIILDLFGPDAAPTGARLFLAGPAANQPLVVNYNGADRTKSDPVVLDFKATFANISAPLFALADFDGDLTSMNGFGPNGTAPTMNAFSTGSGKFGTLANGDSIMKNENNNVTSLEGVINFRWNTNISNNGDKFTINLADVAVSPVPEPGALLSAFVGVITLGSGVSWNRWRNGRRRQGRWTRVITPNLALPKGPKP
jgi:hypothetical protein